MINYEIKNGDALSILQSMPSESVDCCITSPPYFNLRDYGVENQIGLEKTPNAYIERLVNVFIEVKRVLKKDGTLWINISDSYAGSGKGAATYPNTATKLQASNKGELNQANIAKCSFGNCKPKDLVGIPWMLAFALRDAGFYLRQDIIWHKPNPMPESVKDRCTKSHEYIFLLSKSKKYYYDAEAIKEPAVSIKDRRMGLGRLHYRGNREIKQEMLQSNFVSIYEKRNKRDVWSVTVKPFKGAHFATFPPDLIEPCILAGARENGVVLDPFCGSGTTGEVALKNNRQFIGIDINLDYCEMSKKRLYKIMMGGG